VDQYLDAVIAHDPKRVPMTANAKFTENGQRLNVGDGFWRSVLSKGNYRLFVTDVEAGQVAFIGTITEGATPAPGAAPRGGGAGAPAGTRGFAAQAQAPRGGGRGGPGAGGASAAPGAGAPGAGAPRGAAAPRGGGGGSTNGGPAAIALRV
jgi:hypothetical protein